MKNAPTQAPMMMSLKMVFMVMVSVA
jgi:hypothetical protein